jgi:outer membrane protein assembly factor BamE (lipoprotein component of BamABCDE complex)
MTRSVFFFGIAMAAVALAFVLTDSVLTKLTAGITEANVRRIRIGMSKLQVERILGEPGRYGPFFSLGLADDPGREVGAWASHQLEVQVSFDRNGRVESAAYSDRWGGVSVLSQNQTWGLSVQRVYQGIKSIPRAP